MEEIKLTDEDTKTIKCLGAAMCRFLKNIDSKIDTVNSSIANLKDTVLVNAIKDVRETSELALKTAQENCTKIDNIQRNVDRMSYNYDLMTEENLKLKKQLNNVEDYGRRNNLVVRGIGESNDENCEQLFRNFMKQQLKFDDEFIDSVQIVRCHRLFKRKVGQTWSRPLIVRFFYFGNRQDVWNKRHLLANTRFSINENFCADTEFNRNRLYPIYSVAKKLPRYQRKSTMVKDELILDGDNFNVNNIDQLPEDLHPKNFCRKSDGKTVVFGGMFSEFDCFSNWSPSPITYKKIDYVSAEQAYMHMKAQSNGDSLAAKHIMFTSNSREIKTIGRSIKINGQWEQMKKDIMLNIIRAKFAQNQEMKKQLLDTGNRKLGEAGKDTFFAIGLPLTSKTVLNSTTWTSQSELGNILETVRSELK